MKIYLGLLALAGTLIFLIVFVMDREWEGNIQRLKDWRAPHSEASYDAKLLSPLGLSDAPGLSDRVRALPLAGLDQARMRGAAVALSPVFGVPVGSISRMCTSPRATGRCSTPLRTT